ncbi:MAG: hypothetical protein NWT08_00960 [Akkermansiaceae bacterium]|jgi:thymidylate kinase|nr:hypothetical protein [Akkermansiaceae bacterium]MDP4721658.1 hypothetical protein [Akkermansiaceae bacterium]MDP4778830.1 hypothetical protein [Akkermansiaceae bacterium]MDP4846969.1 hypothetical protein [Akkermansiaceae bacterium]MDP4997027.1 hypothetical protein [Akkermansiaceae bacterium]
MPFIAFLGCDGSGKSAVIQRVSEHLKSEGHAVTLGHWCPKMKSDAASQSAAATDNPHGQKARGIVTSLLKLGWLLMKWRLAWAQRLGAASRNGYVIFDRYHGDLLVDPIRYRYGGSLGLAWVIHKLMPQPDHVIFLDAEPDVLLSRKQEVSREALEKGRMAYRQAGERLRGFVEVDAGVELERVVSKVLKIIQ